MLSRLARQPRQLRPALCTPRHRGYAFLPFELTSRHREHFKISGYTVFLWCMLGSVTANLLWRRQEHQEWVDTMSVKIRRLEQASASLDTQNPMTKEREEETRGEEEEDQPSIGAVFI
ncbi:MAG: hypothetical protein DHS80DRAFT_29081 [Piptocephalis tieghemiana]|nr:MAG: hypothetical protein DHS80DRAFT_29081 [Piptocephalis tieghemiana]